MSMNAARYIIVGLLLAGAGMGLSQSALPQTAAPPDGAAMPYTMTMAI